MRVLIVDDEAAARRRLEIMLEELDVEVAGAAAGGIEALELARATAPDVILLDIVMPDIDGIDVARHLAAPRPLIVFQTAHASYALNAFEQEAVDYVLKPVTLERLRVALARAAGRLNSGAAAPDAQLLERLGSSLGDAAARRRRVLVQDGGGHRLVPLRDVLHFTSGARAVWACTDSERLLVDYTLGELEARTAGDFVRVSRSDLVNVEHVVRIVPEGDGTARLQLTGGRHVRVSRRRLAAVRSALVG